MLDSAATLWAFIVALVLLVWSLNRRSKAKFRSIDAVPGPESPSFLKGHLRQLFATDAWPFLDHLTSDYAPIVKLRGFFGERMLYVYDPKALQHIVLKDQDLYDEGRLAKIFNRLLFGYGLFGTTGEHHRRQRKMINPVFSVAHLKHLTPVFYETAHRLCEGIKLQLKESSTTEVDILAWMGRTALELIGRGALGRSFDPLVTPARDPYADALKQFVPTGVRIQSRQALIPLYMPFLMLGDRVPAVRRLLGRVGRVLPHPGVREMQGLVETCWSTSREIYAERMRALVGGDEEVKVGVAEGRDLLSVLLRANMEAAEEDRLPEDEIIAQISSFTFAGTDTTSNALARTLHLLCMHPDVQEELRAELLNARHENGGKDLEYDDLTRLPYLDAVCRETLRLYPPVAFMRRQAMADTVLPLSAPIGGADGSTLTSVHVPKGTTVFVGVYSCNRNAALWGADADAWRPARWLDGGVPENVAAARIPGVYSHLMTFNGGGRACIGFKFSQLEMKVVLSALLTSFRFTLAGGAKADIIWNRGIVTYPSTREDSERPSLTLEMEAI